MEQRDWLQALNEFNDRLESLERYQRLHAQSIAHLDEGQVQSVRKLSGIHDVALTQINSRLEMANATIITKFAQIDQHMNDNAQQFAERDAPRGLLNV
jgi:hypothetical protein